MLTQDYVSWVVIGAIDSTTDQLLFAHVCFGKVQTNLTQLTWLAYIQKKQPHGLLFIAAKMGLCHELFQPSLKFCALLWMAKTVSDIGLHISELLTTVIGLTG
jgi:hypothetical protein